MNGTCQFLKKDQQRCKRSVANEERFCWQHATSWRSKFNSLSKNAKVTFCVGIASLAITVYALFQHNNPSVHTETSGNNSPIIQGNEGSVTFNKPQPKTPPKKATKGQKASGGSQGSK